MMLRSHKITLQPNNKQVTYLVKACGVARFAYNWGLARWSEQYRAWKADPTLTKPSQLSLRRELNAMKREHFPWMLEVTKNAPQMAIIHLGRAFENFFAGRAKYPTFKKKGVHDSFSLTNDQFRVKGKHIHIPNLGWVRMREALRFEGKVMSASVSRRADKWFVSITVDTEDVPPRCKSQAVGGVDLGINRLATCSDGTLFHGRKPYHELLARLRRVSRSLSRKQKGSHNRRKAQMKLARLYARITDIRNDELHKLTTGLAGKYRVVVIEDLNVKGMMSNRHLARAVGDMGFHEFRRQLEYKMTMRGGSVLVADRWYPSSRLCSACGEKHEAMPLSVRSWTCPRCGAHHDRDLNAAKNLTRLAVSSTVTARGGEGAGVVQRSNVKPSPTKREFNIRSIYGRFE